MPSRNTWSEVDPAALTALAPTVKRVACLLMARLPANIAIDDLTQAGLIGVMEAFRTFKPDKGRTLEGYAMMRAECSMLDELRRIDHLTRGQRQRVKSYLAAVDELQQRLGRSARDSELSEALGCELAELRETAVLVAAGGGVAYLEDLRCVPAIWERMMGIDLNDGAHLAEKTQAVDGLMAALELVSPRHRELLRRHYLDGEQMVDIARSWDVTPSRVSQIHAEALKAVRTAIEAPAAVSAPRRRPDPPKRAAPAVPVRRPKDASQHRPCAFTPRFSHAELFAPDLVSGFAGFDLVS